MKKIFAVFTILFLALPVFAQETAETTIEGGPFLFVFDEGASYAQVTRVEKQTNRSNFVRENMMAGAFFSFQTVNLGRFDIIEQLSAYYTFYNAFNGMQQFPKNIINYAVDNFLGITKCYDKLNFVNVNFAAGMHYMFQLTDEWPMHYIGLGLKGALEFPVTEGFTIVNNYFVSFDNANIGPNKLMQPFEISYQYHIDLGVRFSKRVANSYCYVKPKSL